MIISFPFYEHRGWYSNKKIWNFPDKLFELVISETEFLIILQEKVFLKNLDFSQVKFCRGFVF